MRPLTRHIMTTILLACLVLATYALAGQRTVVRRAAFDVGSANVKCTIADVDTVSGDIVGIVETLAEKVDFVEDLSRSYDSNLSKKIMDKGVEVIQRMKRQAIELDAQEFSGAGGSIFRQARNGRAYFVRLDKETGIPCRVISEQQAAVLSYHAVRQTLGQSTRDLLVWDIGANSMNMTARRNDGSLIFYIDPMASIPFKKAVIETIQKKDIAATPSPNPMSKDQVNRALTFIQSHAAMSVQPIIKARVKHTNMLVAGIGGVHYYSVPELLGGRKKSYTRDEVAQALELWTGKTDEEFDSEYADTRLTNLILVLGYMDALGMDEIYPLKVNQADGLLAAPEFW